MELPVDHPAYANCGEPTPCNQSELIEPLGAEPFDKEAYLKQLESLTSDVLRLMVADLAEVLHTGCKDNPALGDYSKAAVNFLEAWMRDRYRLHHARQQLALVRKALKATKIKWQAAVHALDNYYP